jgi:hypothetical protein
LISGFVSSYQINGNLSLPTIILMLIAIGYVDVIDEGPPAGGGGPKEGCAGWPEGSPGILQKYVDPYLTKPRKL